MEAWIERVRLPLRAPLRTAAGELRERDLLLLRVRDRDRVEGVGEAAPLEPYDGVPLDACRAALEDAVAALGAGGGRAEAADAAVLPQAVAAVDVALWDLAGRRAGRPVWALLGAAAAGEVEVNALIGAEDRAGAAAQAAAAGAAGFRCVKLKVGLGDDAARVAAVRAAAGPAMEIRLDANGAWEVDEAVAVLRALAPAGIELCEEPVHGVDELREVSARSPVAVAMDETAAAPGALGSGAADAVCLKLARCGGITGVLDAARTARAAGAQVYLASSLDGPVGIAAALHAAAALKPDRPCGLATLGLLAGLRDPFPPRAGRMPVPRGAGLGVGAGPGA